MRVLIAALLLMASAFAQQGNQGGAYIMVELLYVAPGTNIPGAGNCQPFPAQCPPPYFWNVPQTGTVRFWAGGWAGQHAWIFMAPGQSIPGYAYTPAGIIDIDPTQAVLWLDWQLGGVWQPCALPPYCAGYGNGWPIQITPGPSFAVTLQGLFTDPTKPSGLSLSCAITAWR